LEELNLNLYQEYLIFVADPRFGRIVHLECGDRSSHFSSNSILYVFFLFLV